MSDAPYRGSDRRVFWWLLLGLVVLFGGMYVALVMYAGQRLPHGTDVAGIDVGRLAGDGRLRSISGFFGELSD